TPNVFKLLFRSGWSGWFGRSGRLSLFSLFHRRAFNSLFVKFVVDLHHCVGAALFRGVFGPGCSSLCLSGSSSSPRSRNLGIVRGRFSLYGRRGCPICRSLSLLHVHLALIIVRLAAAS